MCAFKKKKKNALQQRFFIVKYLKEQEVHGFIPYSVQD